MTAPFSDELISAYLDGELTAQEQERVATQLREHAELRRMCDELRALRSTLQAMPVAEPPENLVERIMRQAERRMLSGHQEDVDNAGAAEPTPSAAARHVLRDWRVTLGVVGALAASVLLMVWLQQNAEWNVALAPTVAKSAAAPDSAMTDEALTERMLAEPPLAESAQETASYAIEAQAQDTPSKSRVMHRAPALAPAAPAATAAPEAGSRADHRAEDRASLGAQPQMPGAAGGTARMGGMPGGGQPAAGEPMGPGGMGRGGAYGATGQPVTGAVQPDAPKGQDMGPGMGAGMGMGLGNNPQGGMGGMGYPGSGAASGRGMIPEMAAPPSAAPGTGMPGVAPPSDSAAAADTLVRKGEEANHLQYKHAAPADEQLIGQLISQLDQDQMLLVKLHVPQVELQGSLDELQKSNRLQVLATDGSVARLTEREAVPSVMLQTEAVAGAELATIVPTEAFRAQLGRDSQKVLVLNGSADQIRAVLTNLAALGVAIEPAEAELDTVRDLWMKQSSGLEGRDTTTPDADSPVMDKDDSLGKRGRSAKSEEVAQQPTPQRVEQAYAIGKNKGASLPPGKEWKDRAKETTMVYVYFLLHPDTATAAPAAKPENR